MPFMKSVTPCKKCQKPGLFRWKKSPISNPTKANYLYGICVKCERSLTKKHQQENRESWRKYTRKSYAKNGRRVGSTEVYHKRLKNRRRTDELTKFVTEEARKLARQRTNITGFQWHVDHVIPLNGITVSGLHVWNNLQVIPASLNYSKRNRVVEEMINRPT